MKNQNTKIIFGLKVRQFRLNKGLLFDDLKKRSGISASYLNEIEKGKKYPKAEKMQALADALEVSIEELQSEELSGALAPVGKLLKSNFLSELPLDLFGIELSKVVQIIASAPKHVGAFISTLVELGRNYAVQEGNFYHRAMRAYQELNLNYFEDLEKAASDFIDEHQLTRGGATDPERLAEMLTKNHNYKIDYNGLEAYPELQFLRAVFIPKKKRLLLNNKLTKNQQAFQMAKELGYDYLKIKERSNTSSLLEVKNFDSVYNHFKASYFAAAVLVDEKSLVNNLQSFLQRSSWDANAFKGMLDKYQATPQHFLHRVVSMLPKHFDLSSIYLLRCIQNTKNKDFKIDRELHLNHSHRPHGNGLSEHYCRRWQTIRLSKALLEKSTTDHSDVLLDAQRIRYYGTEEEYLTITFAHPAYSTDHHLVSITVGILLDEQAKSQIGFWNDPAIPFELVNVTCERCPIKDCRERAISPKVIEKKLRKQ
ncbi:MAG: helix-turn-helix domain-containing protein, partial [Saprospiraceae bacterium]